MTTASPTTSVHPPGQALRRSRKRALAIAACEPSRKRRVTVAQRASVPPRGAVRVILAEGHPAVRFSVEQAFADRLDIELLDSGRSAEEVVRDADRADVAIVDHERAAADGLTLTRTLAGLPGGPAVVILSAYADVRMTLAAVLCGAAGLISTAVSGDELCEAVLAVARGRRHLPAVAMSATMDVLGDLTSAERSTAMMLLSGLEADSVARALGLTDEDLEARRSRILDTIESPGYHRGDGRAVPGSRAPRLRDTSRPHTGVPGTIELAVLQRVEVG